MLTNDKHTIGPLPDEPLLGVVVVVLVAVVLVVVVLVVVSLVYMFKSRKS